MSPTGRINRSHENVQMLENIVDNFPKRLKACLEAKGGHFIIVLFIIIVFVMVSIKKIPITMCDHEHSLVTGLFCCTL